MSLPTLPRCLAALVFFLFTASSAWAQSDLLFSEYVEGSSNNKALEIYNGTGAAVDLSKDEYVIQFYFNGSNSAGLTIPLSGTIAEENVFVLAHSSAASDILVVADQTAGGNWYNGDDAIILRRGGGSGEIHDVIGQVGFDPGSEWGSGLTSTADNTLRRKATSCSGDTNPDDPFDPSVNYDGYAQDTFEGLGEHVADCKGGDVPTVSFASPNSQTVTEGTDTQVEIEVQIENPGAEAVTVDVVLTDDGTADEADFDGETTQTVTFPAGDESPQIATFTLIDDEEDEGAEAAIFSLQNLVSDDPDATIGSPSNYTLAIEDDDAAPSVLVINEIHADPSTSEGDANNDGIIDTTDDEFVEIVNAGAEAIDLSGYTLSDAQGVRHTFPEGTILASNQAIVVFAAGDPQGNFGGALVQLADFLGLNNTGDTVTLKNNAGNVVAEVSYGNEGNNDQSLTRDPDLTGGFVPHFGATDADGALFSPGTWVDGTPFGGGNADAIVTVIKGEPGWRMLAPPVGGMTVSDLAAQNLVQGLSDEYPDGDINLLTNYNGNGWEAPPNSDASLTRGEGFIWYFFDIAYDPHDEGITDGESESFELPVMLESVGDTATAEVTVDLHADGDKWNLLGNPFAEAIDLDLMEFASEDDSLASSIGQVWEPDGRSYVLTTETPVGDAVNTLAIWQGAFFQNATATEVAFPVTSKLGSGAPFYGRPGGVERGRIGFELAGPVLEDSTLASFDRAIVLYLDAEAADGWDRRDATKLTPLRNTYATLAFVGERGGEEVLKAQESRPFEGGDFEVPLAFESVGVSGTFGLSWPRWVNVPDDWAITLTDAETGQTVDLRSDTLYTFAASSAREAVQTDPLAPPPIESLRRSGEPRFVLAVERGSVDAEDGAAPLAFELGAVHPNPTSGASVVRYALPEAADVRLEVYDVLGRRVATLADGPEAAGRHTATVRTVGLASGVYVVRLRAGEHVASRRFVVVR